MDACVIACEDADNANEQKVFTVSGSAKANLSYSAANVGLGISRLFSDFTAGLQYEQLPEKVRHECKRGLLDWLGCALAGSDTDTVRRLKSALDATGSLPKTAQPASAKASKAIQ